MKKDLVKAITLGGIFAAIYAVITILSVYVVNALSVAMLMIMPILAAYYACIFKFKEVIVFNLATLLVCFISGIGDPLYCLLYVLPTLIVGDTFGLFNHLKLKFYTTLFLQTITYSITNILALYLGEFFYEVNIIDFIIVDKWVSSNLALSILFILSGAEAVISSMIINDQLKPLGLERKKETNIPLYVYIASFVLFGLDIAFYFINKNFYFLIFTMLFIILVPVFIQAYKSLKNKNLITILYIFVVACLNFFIAYLGYGYFIPLIVVFPLVIYCLVKLIIYIYNVKRKGEES